MHVLRASSCLLVASVFALAQQPRPAAPQTARQALIEMITGGENGIRKHLTTEVQQALKRLNNAPAGTALGIPIGEGQGMQTFESGQVLLVYSQPAQHKKFEVHVDNDDLSGEEDSFELSLHSFTDGQEQTDEWQFLASHLTVSMKRQEGIWRLNKISVGAEFPVGDAAFIEKVFGKGSGGQAAAVGLNTPTTETHVSAHFGLPDEKPQGMPAEQVVTMLGLAESTFARIHPDTGFTCSFSELAETAKMMGVDQQVNTGSYNGYRFALAGCAGRPAGSFQITAEPTMASPGGKAFCADATQNLRVSDDGRAATCLAAGKAHQVSADGAELQLRVNPEK